MHRRTRGSPAEVRLMCSLSRTVSIAASPVSGCRSKNRGDGRIIQASLSGVSKSFGARTILSGLDFEVAARARIGVIGPNGGGKSTLLRILGGLEDVDSGTAARRRGLLTAYLPQPVEPDPRTPRQIVRAARPEIERLAGGLAEGPERLGPPRVSPAPRPRE